MATKNYIAAIEIGSSKITGAIGIETYEGIKIAAYASEQVNGFIAKGVVRNVDETGNSLTSIINRLESQLENVSIEKAYVSFGGISLKSIPSAITMNFDEYTKITQKIIDDITQENDKNFEIPAGYRKTDTIPMECKLNGDTTTTPIGIHTQRIECRYLNIIVKEQYMKQLEESFGMAAIGIANSINSIRIEADMLLNDDEKRSGCALVNIGSETTTIAIYTNNLLRNLCVLPLGSDNITKDLCNEDISQQEAEQLKIFKGFQSNENDNSLPATETVNKIIGARMTEILQNIRNRIESSGEAINRVIFCGGGSKLKNIDILVEENIPNMKIRFANEPATNYISDENLMLTKGAISPTLLGLLKQGKENCCKEIIMQAEPEQIQETLFKEEEVKEQHEQKTEPENAKEITKKQKEKGHKKTNYFESLRHRLTLFGDDLIKNITETDDVNEKDEKN